MACSCHRCEQLYGETRRHTAEPVDRIGPVNERRTHDRNRALRVREYQTFRLFKRTALYSTQETPGVKSLVFDVTSEELHLWSLIGVAVTTAP